MSIIINVQALKEKLYNPSLVVMDVRTKYESFPTGEAAYENNHIPKAVYVDFKRDLSGKDTFLPDVQKLAEKLSRLGIERETEIVIYDEGNHRAASKAWFVLHYIGHRHVQILNGGYRSWVEAGGEVTSDISQREPKHYIVEEQPHLVLHIDDIKTRLATKQSVLIDSRSKERFTGEKEPKYKKAGHIPGAINYHSKLVFNEEGLWKTDSELDLHFSKLKEKDEIIVSCGSGNSACMNLVALKEAGYENIKIYPGGFSEWIEDDKNEVETGE